ncbi:uncharacterized protein LOC135390994 [Ornithodoros turicata]|uniref:uncharacterized protein LOC135390994 n=1 Tax=Ornithodoros turicata TaxID=34597 RepID=UPI00313A2710
MAASSGKTRIADLATLSDRWTESNHVDKVFICVCSFAYSSGKDGAEAKNAMSSAYVMVRTSGSEGRELMRMLNTFIAGLRDQRIRAKLVLEKNLTVDIALRLAESSLAAEAGSRDLDISFAGNVGKVFLPPKQNTVKCFRCGNHNHDAGNCRFRNESCHECGKRGHIASMCHQRGRTSQKPRNKSASARKVQSVTISNVFSVDENDGRFITCRISGYKVSLQVDTGSKATLLNKATWEMLGMPELLPVQHRLQCFDEKPINVFGRAQLDVCWKEHSFKLEAIFTEANAINIMGRTWISALLLDLNKLFVCVTESSPVLGSSLQELVTKYPAVFRDGLGRCTKTKVQSSNLTASPSSSKHDQYHSLSVRL